MDWVQPLGAVGTVFGLLAAFLFVLRRKGLVRGPLGLSLPKTNRRLAVIERLMLTPQHSLHLVRIGGKVVLVGVSPQGCSLIDHPACDGLELEPSHPAAPRGMAAALGALQR